MKKRLTSILIVCMLAGLMLSGCKKETKDVFIPDDQQHVEADEQEKEEQKQEQAQEPVKEEPKEEKPSAGGSAYTAPDADNNVSFVIVNAGGNDTEVSLNWYSKAGNKGKAIVAKASEMNGNNFPSNYLSGECDPFQTESEGNVGYTVKITGLEPNTEYAYMVGNDGGWSRKRTFRTANRDDLMVFVTGDIQLGSGDDFQTSADAWKKIASDAKQRFPECSLHLNMGDVTTLPFEDQYLYVVDTPMFSDTQVNVVRGNHDYNSPMDNHFTRPNMSDFGRRDEQQNGNYWFRQGDVLFMELNFAIEDLDISVEHRYFIKYALEENPDVKWKVVMMHYSPFSSVAKYQDYSNANRQYWTAVFDEFGIDVVLCGHDHVYTRNYIYKNNQPQKSDATSVTNPDGTLYVTFGSASGSQYHDAAPNPFAAKIVQNYNPQMAIVEFTDTDFNMTVFESDSWNVIDQYNIHKE